MGIFDRLRGRRPASASGGGRRNTLDRPSGSADLSHLEQFVATRRGVEGYVEPRTAVTETTILLVAADGEWTRRRIDGPETARVTGRWHGEPVDLQLARNDSCRTTQWAGFGPLLPGQS